MNRNRATRLEVLPASLPPIGINRVQAAAFIGVSTSFFDTLVAEGAMPRPRKVHDRVIWDVQELVEHTTRLPAFEGVLGPT